jgi:hypothetical protein
MNDVTQIASFFFHSFNNFFDNPIPIPKSIQINAKPYSAFSLKQVSTNPNSVPFQKKYSKIWGEFFPFTSG